jgi:hypothetical protein
VGRAERGGLPKWDEFLKCKCDIDATLQELMDNRLVWNEARFCFVQERDKNLGGNSLYRSEERIATEKRHLKRKWKSHIRMAHRHEADQGATADRRTGMRASPPSYALRRAGGGEKACRHHQRSC